MKLQVEIPDSIAVQMQELASRERVSMDNLVATALTAQLDKSPKRPTITERARRVDWTKVDAILARVPDDSPSLPEDKR